MIVYWLKIYISYNYIVEIDNELNLDPNENEIIYNKKTNLNFITFYYTEYNLISYNKYFNKSNPTSSNDFELLFNEQINLTKNHQINGFGI